jgi:hypothetical protein
MHEPLGIIEILGLAASISLLAGWRLYLCMLATGIAMRMGVLSLPEHLESLAVLANPWVMGIVGTAAVIEFFADKIAWLDSAWDGLHTLIRPLGGALLTLAIVDPSDPAVQVVAFILGGGATLLSHGGKAGARALQQCRGFGRRGYRHRRVAGAGPRLSGTGHRHCDRAAGGGFPAAQAGRKCAEAVVRRKARLGSIIRSQARQRG